MSERDAGQIRGVDWAIYFGLLSEHYGPQLPKTAENMALLAKALRSAGETAKARFVAFAAAVNAARDADEG